MLCSCDENKAIIYLFEQQTGAIRSRAAGFFRTGSIGDGRTEFFHLLSFEAHVRSLVRFLFLERFNFLSFILWRLDL